MKRQIAAESSESIQDQSIGTVDTFEQSSRPLKRTKIRLACQACRDRKIRCSGETPCSSCIRKKVADACVYDIFGQQGAGGGLASGLSGGKVEDGYVKSLETRIRELEERGREQLRLGSESGTGHAQVGVEGRYSFERTSLSQSSPIAFGQTHGHRTSSGHLERGPGQVQGGEGRYSFEQNHEPRISAGHLENAPRASVGSHWSASNRLNDNGNGGPQQVLLQSQNQREDSSEEQVVSAMGATEGTSPSAKNTGSVFLGPSSAAAFMNLVRNKSQRRPSRLLVGDTPSSTASRPHRPRGKREVEMLRALMDEVVLPPRRVADEHMSTYWAFVHPLYPILHQPTFMHRYKQVWTDHAFDDPSQSVHSLRAFFSILNALLALGCRYSSVVGLSSTAPISANTFFERSQNLIAHDSSDHGCLELVQSLCLAAQYLQGSDKVNRCSCSLGMAIRVAQGIGIHLDSEDESQAEREERRRTWWCCVLMDRVLSMTFGRPPMVIWPSMVPFPLMIDDEYLSSEPGSVSNTITPSTLSKVTFFVYALKLSDVLIDILKYFYTPRVEHRPLPIDGFHLEDCQPLVDIDDRLDKWYDDVPEGLRYNHESSKQIEAQQDIFWTQAVTLHCRYLHLKILVFRPVLVDYAHSAAQSTPVSTRSILKLAFAHGCIDSCVSAAQRLIAVLTSSHNEGLRLVSWYRIFYLYTSGTVLLAIMLNSSLSHTQRSNLPGLHASFDSCMHALDEFSSKESADDNFAHKCWAILRTAYERVPVNGDIESQTLAKVPTTHHQAGTGADNGHISASSQVYHGAPPSWAGRDGETGGLYEDLSFMFLDEFWPNGGVEWLSGIPVEAGFEAAGVVEPAWGTSAQL